MDLFAAGSAQVLVLLALRVGGLLLIAPVYSAKTVPMPVRTGLLLLLTVLLHPVAAASLGPAAAGAAVTPVTFLGETVIGFGIGLGAAVLVAAAEGAGDLMATTVGLSGASLLDPLNGASSPVLAQLAQMFAVTVLLTLDGHLVMLDALAESVRAVPVGTAVDLRAGVGAMLSTAGQLFVLGLRFAAPVVAATMIGNVALAVLTRAAPQLNVLSVAFPIQIGLGLVALVASLAFLATWLTTWDGWYAGGLQHVFAALVPR